MFEIGDEFFISGSDGSGDVEVGVGVLEIVAEVDEGFDEMVDAFFANHAGEVADYRSLCGSSECGLLRRSAKCGVRSGKW